MTEMVPALSAHNQALLDDFLKDCELRRLTKGTIRSHKSNVRTVGKFLEENEVNFCDLDKESLKGVLNYLQGDRGVSFKTLDCYFTALSSFYEFLEFEERVPKNPIPSFRKRYLQRYKKDDSGSKRKLIGVEEMAMLINSSLEVRDKAIMTLLAKTGVRRTELIMMDVDDINWDELSIKLKQRKKRSNLTVFLTRKLL